LLGLCLPARRARSEMLRVGKKVSSFYRTQADQRGVGQLGDVGGDAPGLVAGEEVRNPGRFLRYIKVTAKERCSQMLRPATGFAEP
jgi:hypothetical protein